MTEPVNQDNYPFLVKTYPGIVQAPRVRVAWKETMKVKRVLGDLPGFGRMREIEHDGWDHSRLAVAAATSAGATNDFDTPVSGEVRVLGASGSRTRSGGGSTVANSTPGLKTVVRRIQDRDREALQQVDVEIAALETRLLQARAERKTLIAAAWKRGKGLFAHEVAPTGEGSGAIYLDS